MLLNARIALILVMVRGSVTYLLDVSNGVTLINRQIVNIIYYRTTRIPRFLNHLSNVQTAKDLTLLTTQNALSELLT